MESELAVKVAAHVSNRSVPQIREIHALRQQSERMEEVQILSVVIESGHGLYIAPANAEPGFEPVVRERPVEGGMPLSQVAEVAIVNLRVDANLVGNLRRDVGSEVRERAAALPECMVSQLF